MADRSGNPLPSGRGAVNCSIQYRHRRQAFNAMALAMNEHPRDDMKCARLTIAAGLSLLTARPAPAERIMLQTSMDGLRELLRK